MRSGWPAASLRAILIGMNLKEFRDAVAAHPDCSLRIEVAGGQALAPHFHVTEVGRVTKHFIDCGGTPRTETRCVLQTLVASDTDHRLNTTKLAGILSLVDRLELPGDTPVEVEHQERSISTDNVESVAISDDTLVIRLAPKQTACLAEDLCGIGPQPQGTALPIADDECCSGPGCC